MKRLLFPLLAALALPTTAYAEEFIEIKPNIYSYKKSSLQKSESEGKRFIHFWGTTLYTPCFSKGNPCTPQYVERFNKNWDGLSGSLSFTYQVDCINKTFNRYEDRLPWKYLYVDQTAFEVAKKFCPIEEWRKLPNKNNGV